MLSFRHILVYNILKHIDTLYALGNQIKTTNRSIQLGILEIPRDRGLVMLSRYIVSD